MNNKNKKCGWCGADTKDIYKLKDGRHLCLECALKHYNIIEEKMNKHIEIDILDVLIPTENGIEKSRIDGRSIRVEPISEKCISCYKMGK